MKKKTFFFGDLNLILYSIHTGDLLVLSYMTKKGGVMSDNKKENV